MLIKPGLTMRQIGARYKLCFSRFDRDRKAREHTADNAKEAPTPCTCGCLNHLESWIKVCTEPKTVDRIKLARVRIATMLRDERPLEAVIAPLLAGQDQMFLWRANWQEVHMVALAECYQARTMTDQQWRAAQRALRAVTEELISASLDLHGLRKEKATEWTGVKYNPRESNKIRKERDAVERALLAKFHIVDTFFPHVDPTQTPSIPTLHPTPAPFRRPHNLQVPMRQLRLAPLPEDTSIVTAPMGTPSPTAAVAAVTGPTATTGSLYRYFIRPARMVGSRRQNVSTRTPARRLVAQAPARPMEEETSAIPAHMGNVANGLSTQQENRGNREPGSSKLARRRRSVNGESSAQAIRRRSERSERPP